MHDDYKSFLDSINAIFLKAMITKDYKLALQVKALEAKCRGYLSQKQQKASIGLDTSIEGLQELLKKLTTEMEA